MMQLGDIFDFLDMGGSVSDWYMPDFSVTDWYTPDFAIPDMGVPDMADFAIDTSSWVYDSATGNIIDASQWMIVNDATLNAAIDIGVMPDVSTLPVIDSVNAVNAANSTFVEAGPGAWYDTATGTTYAPDGSVIDAAGNFVEKGSSFILPTSSSLMQLVKAGWSALSQYRATSTADGRTVLVPRTQVGYNGQITSGPYAGQTANTIPGVQSSFAGIPQNMLIPLGICALALFSTLKGQ